MPTYDIKIMTPEQATGKMKLLLRELLEVDKLEYENWNCDMGIGTPPYVYYTFSIPIPMGMPPAGHRKEVEKLLGDLWADVDTAQRRDHILVTIREDRLKGEQP